MSNSFVQALLMDAPEGSEPPPGPPTCIADPYYSCGPACDPYWANVVLQLHFDGTDGSTTFTDSSLYGQTITRDGTIAAISTSNSKFGGASVRPATVSDALLFDGLRVAANADFNFGSADWTIEAWVYLPSGGTYTKRLFYSNTNQGIEWQFDPISGGTTTVPYRSSIGAGLLSARPCSVDTWHHVALVRGSTALSLYIDGILAASTTFNIGTGSFDSSGTDLFIGKFNQTGGQWHGYIDDFRITKGIARYTGNFNIPTEAFPDCLEAMQVPIAPASIVPVSSVPLFAPFNVGSVAPPINNITYVYIGQWTNSYANTNVKVYELNTATGVFTEISTFNAVISTPTSSGSSDVSCFVYTAGTTLYVHSGGTSITLNTYTLPTSVNFPVYHLTGTELYLFGDSKIHRYTVGVSTLQVSSADLSAAVDRIIRFNGKIYASTSPTSSGSPMVVYEFDPNTLALTNTYTFGLAASSQNSHFVVIDGVLHLYGQATYSYIFDGQAFNTITSTVVGVPGTRDDSNRGWIYWDGITNNFLSGTSASQVGVYTYNRFTAREYTPRTILSSHADTLIPGSGTTVAELNFETGIVDISSIGATLTPYVNYANEPGTDVSTVTSYTGTKSLAIRYQDATSFSNRVFLASSNPAYALDGDFTIKFAHRSASTTATPYIRVAVYSAIDTPVWEVSVRNDGTLTVGFTGPSLAATLATKSGALTNTWYAIVICRKNGVVTVYIDGIAGTPVSNAVSLSAGTLVIAGPYASSPLPNEYAPGGTATDYIDDIKIISGYAELPLYTPDSSCYQPKTVSLTGISSLSTIEKKFGVSSFLSPNAGLSTLNGVTITDHQDFDFGIQDFTIELWAYRNANTYAGYLYYFTMGGEFSFVVGTDGLIDITYRSGSGTQQVFNVATFPLSQWNFVTLQRRGANFETYLNGTLINAITITGGVTSTVNASGTHYLGRTDTSATTTWNGYIDEVRVTKGVARYPQQITPNLPYPTGGSDPQWGDTAVLSYFNGTNGGTSSTDLSSNGFVINCVNGATISSAVSLYGGTSLYIPGSVNNQGATIVGSADAANFGTGDFEVEIAFYIHTVTTDIQLISSRNTVNNNGWAITVQTNGVVTTTFQDIAGPSSAVGAITTGKWQSIRVRKTGGLVYLVVNDGVTTSATAIDFLVSGDIQIGYRQSFNSRAGVYVGAVRITKGSTRSRYISFDPNTLENCDSTTAGTPPTINGEDFPRGQVITARQGTIRLANHFAPLTGRSMTVSPGSIGAFSEAYPQVPAPIGVTATYARTESVIVTPGTNTTRTFYTDFLFTDVGNFSITGTGTSTVSTPWVSYLSALAGPEYEFYISTVGAADYTISTQGPVPLNQWASIGLFSSTAFRCTTTHSVVYGAPIPLKTVALNIQVRPVATSANRGNPFYERNYTITVVQGPVAPTLSSTLTINIQDTNVTVTKGSSFDIAVGVTYTSSGYVNYSTGGGTWVSGAPIPVATASNYEIRATLVSSTVTKGLSYTGAAVGVWHRLSSDVSWGLYANSVFLATTAFRTLFIEIRAVGTALVLDSATVTLRINL